MHAAIGLWDVKPMMQPSGAIHGVYQPQMQASRTLVAQGRFSDIPPCFQHALECEGHMRFTYGLMVGCAPGAS